ncbi:MAG: isoprenylcysteine carboxylmethyltransferase family protein [Calditrichia bacterium]
MNIKQFAFKYRGYTPLPLLIPAIIFAQPTGFSFLIGGVLMLTGEFIRFWGVAYAGGETRTRKVGASRLVSSGPFAWVRNPLYLGNIFMYVGAAVIANFWMPWLPLIAVVYFGVQYSLIIQLEEEKLRSLFGEEYEAYCRRVPRLLPLLSPAPSPSEVSPNLPKALRAEKSTFIAFAAVLILLLIRMMI